MATHELAPRASAPESLPRAADAGAPLAARIRAGDAEAVGAFYDRWFDACVAIARQVSGRDEAFCLDVVQEVMLRVIRRLPALADERATRAWLARTVFTATVDQLRRDTRRARRERGRAAGESFEADAATALLDAERARWLEERLAELPEADRALLDLRFCGDATLEEVGRRLGMTGHAAHGRIRRLVERLRRAAEEVFG